MSHRPRPGSRLRRPFILGLTGSIGMGKSAAAAMFEREGVPVFDADAEVHRLQGPGGALVAAIEARFPGTTGPSGVDRQKLGTWVLGNRHELAALEAIVTPQSARRKNASSPDIVRAMSSYSISRCSSKRVAGERLARSPWYRRPPGCRRGA